jgi:hypothetical protein
LSAGSRQIVSASQTNGVLERDNGFERQTVAAVRQKTSRRGIKPLSLTDIRAVFRLPGFGTANKFTK